MVVRKLLWFINFEWVDKTLRAAEHGRARLDVLAREAAAEWSVSEDACRAYLTDECTYTLGEDELCRSLLTFRDRAASLALCEADITPAAIPLGELHA